MANLVHVLLKCPCTENAYNQVTTAMNLTIEAEEWILGHSRAVNPMIWLTNFALYKSHLIAAEGLEVHLSCIVTEIFSLYAGLFGMDFSVDWFKDWKS